MKKIIMLWIALGGLIGCGSTTETIRTQERCSVEEVDEGAHIICPDGTSVVVRNGVDGARGEKGTAGKNATPSQPIYVGYHCGRTLVKIHTKVYLVSSGLIEITDKWYKVSNSCKVRYYRGKVYQTT